jgi:hypothetical protein
MGSDIHLHRVNNFFVVAFQFRYLTKRGNNNNLQHGNIRSEDGYLVQQDIFGALNLNEKAINSRQLILFYLFVALCDMVGGFWN